MGKQLQYRRLMTLALLLGVAFAGLGYRLVDLQVLRYQELSARARDNTRREFLLEPRRGDILDAKGNLLAKSVFVKTVCADPVLIGNRQAEVAGAIAPLLSTNKLREVSASELNELIQRLKPRTVRNPQGLIVTNRYVVLKRKVPVEAWQESPPVGPGWETNQVGTWQEIQKAMANLSFGLDEKKLPRSEQAFYRDLRRAAVFAEKLDDQLREYPNKTLAAHVLGYIGMEECEINGRRMLETAGKDGIERTFGSKLAGVRGWRLTETDRPGRELVPWRVQDVEPRDGLNVVLTIDAVVQHIVESALAEAMEKHSPLSVSGIVVRPRTGEILAMATLPNFDPNLPGAAPADARRNRVIADVAEPGSTFKIVVVSAALNEGVVGLNDTFDCEHGRFHFAGRVLHDHESYGVLSVQDIITKSSNIGAAKIGIRLGANRLYDYIRSYGFGTRTGLPLQGEVSGIVHPVKGWSKVSIAQIPMGHGIAVTELQMTMAMCAIANKGVLMRPMLVDRLEDRHPTVVTNPVVINRALTNVVVTRLVVAKYSPQRVRRVISESAAQQMVKALKTVVGPEGTAPKAALAHYTVAGKTGTAQKSGGPTGYLPGKYFASFIGFLPADNPEVCISVMFDEPKQGYYGGQIAAPVFKTIAERVANYLNIRPEEDAAPPVPGNLAASAGDHFLKPTAARSQ